MAEPPTAVDVANLPRPTDGPVVSMFLTVADIEANDEDWLAKGATFLTPPIDRGSEIRCYTRDPDGYLIEVGQSTGLLTRPDHRHTSHST